MAIYLRKLPTDHAARSWFYIWELIGVAERGRQKLLMVNGTKSVVPLKARQEVLKRLRKGHLGRDYTCWACRAGYS